MDDQDARIARENVAFCRAVKEAKVRHATEIAEVESYVNRMMGGEAGVSDIIAVLASRGWMPRIESKEGQSDD
jgi:hypothetical protein